MKVSSPDLYWTLVTKLNRITTVEAKAYECLEGMTSASATLQTFMNADGYVDYSFGHATTKKRVTCLYDWFKHTRKRYKLGCTIAGVPDALLGQCGIGDALWHVEEFIDHAIHFNVDVFGPEASYPIRNCDVLNLDINDPLPARGTWKYINFDCNKLVAGLGDIKKHTTVKDITVVHDRIVSAWAQMEIST